MHYRRGKLLHAALDTLVYLPPLRHEGKALRACIVHDGLDDDMPAIVEHFDDVPIDNAPRLRVLARNMHERLGIKLP